MFCYPEFLCVYICAALGDPGTVIWIGTMPVPEFPKSVLIASHCHLHAIRRATIRIRQKKQRLIADQQRNPTLIQGN